MIPAQCLPQWLALGVWFGTAGRLEAAAVLDVLDLNAQDGLENKMDADVWDAEACERPLLVDLRRETTTLLSDVFFSLGAVIEKSATGAQERLLVYIASKFVGSLAHFLEAHLEMAAYLFRCQFGTEESALNSSYQQLFENLETKMVAYCNLIDSSIEVSESTLPLRQHQPVMPKKQGTLKSARRVFQDIKALGVIQAYDVQHRAWKQGRARDQLDETKLRETLRATEKGAELSTSELVRTTTLVICSTLASVVMALLDIIPELAADLRHMPGGFPAWTPNSMIDLLVDTSANTVDLQEELFLGPIPRGGWPTTRSSPLCKGLQRHGSHGSHGAEQLKEPIVRSVRKDAAGLPTWLGATPKQMLEAIEQSGRPVYHSYVAIRNAAQFDIEKNCEQSASVWNVAIVARLVVLWALRPNSLRRPT
eukprot:s1803_g3.t1